MARSAALGRKRGEGSMHVDRLVLQTAVADIMTLVPGIQTWLPRALRECPVELADDIVNLEKILRHLHDRSVL
jgi:hypothetical protein